jgi:CPA2 family monovalent cation:H+ antiporter-2
MNQDAPLIATLVTGLFLAFVFGLIANRLKLPLITGYLVAGIAIGPFTPGYVGDLGIASQLSELGVILLMFGVGMHFSARDLMAVRGIAVAGAAAQVVLSCLGGVLLGRALGWSLAGGAIFGLSLSVASTVVLLRVLTERNLMSEPLGRVAMGWLVVQDLIMVLVLVLIPPLAGLIGGVQSPLEPGAATEVARMGLSPLWATLLTTAAKIVSFVALMLVVGSRVIPSALHHVDENGPPELFRLAVLAIGLGVAYGSTLFFGVTFSLGAFFAGMVMAGSPLSTQAMKDTLPLRDAFAVLFFVSVGMLFNPAVLWTEPLPLLATVVVILLVKTVGAWAVLRAFGHSQPEALFLAGSLAQIGEFSFILISMTVDLQVIPAMARDLVVAGAMLSMLVNPVMILIGIRLSARLTARPGQGLRPKQTVQP